MPLTMRPTGLGSGIDKDRPGYAVCTGEWEVGRIYQTRGGPGSAGYAFGICAWAALIAITLATAASTSLFIVVLVSFCSPRRAVDVCWSLCPPCGTCYSAPNICSSGPHAAFLIRVASLDTGGFAMAGLP